MKKIIFILMISTYVFANDIIVKESSFSVDKTVENVKHILNKKGLRIFTVIDHKTNASNIGMSMNESKLIIFGNPKMGTLFMNSNMLSGIDLPLKILVYKDNDNKVKLAYRNGNWLKSQYSLNMDKLTDKVTNALNNITNKAIK